jgi:hypothetical protein
MIELEHDRLVFRVPQVHRDAVLRIEFQRTLRIPDDQNVHFLPPGLGRFPLRHVDDYAANVPAEWIEHGGVMLPMYQSEALWVSFRGDYPFAVQVSTGKIDAVTGESLRPGLKNSPQNYLAVPEQPWLDGYCIDRGVIRQFVAMPLGAGYSAEEQITGRGAYGGLQLVVHPMKAEVYARLARHVPDWLCGREPSVAEMATGIGGDMGLAAGGRMRQHIYDDPHDLLDWDQEHASRCFVHLANSLVWRRITGEAPPTVPPTAAEYTRAGLPWFDYYAEGLASVPGSGVLRKLKSVLQRGKERGEVPLPENEPAAPVSVVELRKGLRSGQVREGRF